MRSEYLASSPCTTGAIRRQVVHQKAKNSTSVGRPAPRTTPVGSVAANSCRTGAAVGMATIPGSAGETATGVAVGRTAASTSVGGATAAGLGRSAGCALDPQATSVRASAIQAGPLRTIGSDTPRSPVIRFERRTSIRYDSAPSLTLPYDGTWPTVPQ